MRVFLRSLSTQALVSIVAIGALATQSRKSSNPGPEEVVKKYCRLDFDGVRLSSKSYAQIAPLSLWEEEPGWDEATVISGYQATSVRTQRNGAVIKVRFEILGRLFGLGIFTLNRKSEVMDFSLILSNGKWIIQKPLYRPYISLNTARKHIRELLGPATITMRSAHMLKMEKVLRQLD